MKQKQELNDYALIRALKYLLSQPNKKFSNAAFAREAKMAPSAASYCLNYMLSNGIAERQTIGRTHQYQANSESFLARQWKIVFSCHEIHGSDLVEHLTKHVSNPLSIILYGSVSQGKDDEKSDIDVLVIGDSVRSNELYDIGSVGPREVMIQFYTPAQWRKKALSDKVFYDEVIINSIVLYGHKPVML